MNIKTKIHDVLLLPVLALCFLAAGILGSCDVHEFPQQQEQTPRYTIRLEFDTSMAQKEYPYTKAEDHTGKYDMRYILRAFPVVDLQGNQVVQKEHIWEHIFTSDVQKGNYNVTRDVEMDLPEGEYAFYVWADFVKSGTTGHHFYNPDNLNEITLHAEHKGNTDMREAFVGTAAFRFRKDTVEQGRMLLVNMERPMAKFEFRASDLKEYVEKEYAKTKLTDKMTMAQADSIITRVIENYTVKFAYSGFMPCSFDAFANKPNDARTGVSFETKLSRLQNDEVSMGFDYVFVNGSESKVHIVMSMCDLQGNQIFETNPMEVPIKRRQHTIIRGPFLTIDTRGGVGIDPGFDGSYNYEVKY